MKIFLLLPVFWAVLFLPGCRDNPPVEMVTPEHVLASPQGGRIWASNRAGKSLLLIEKDTGKILKSQKFSEPVNDLLYSGGRLWVICDGIRGSLAELHPETLAVQKEMALGYGPSALVFSHGTKSLWITQRFLNEVWEVNPDTLVITARIAVGREPVGIIQWGNGRHLMIIHNLPEEAATEFPVSAQADLVDTVGKKSTGRIRLPNGSTDVRSVVTDQTEKYAYITHILARYQLPTNQVDRGWMCTNAMSIIDLEKQEYLTTVLLDAPHQGAANPGKVAVSPDNRHICIALNGIDALAWIDREALHKRLEAVRGGDEVSPSSSGLDKISDDTGFLYGIREFIPTQGKGPRGVAFEGGGIVSGNFYSGELFVWEPDSRESHVHLLGRPYSSTPEGAGEMYFHDATLCYQGWQSCVSCHPNGGRVDGLNWDLMNDGAGNPKNTRSLLLSHQTAPCMISGIRKDAETAVRSGIRHILFSVTDENVPAAMDIYLKSLKPMASPFLKNGNLSETARNGKVHFDKYCLSCHSGAYFTDQNQYPVGWAEGADKNTPMDVPALTEVWRTAPYLYDGRAASMQEMLLIHGPSGKLTKEQLEELAEYVLSL